MHDVVDIDVELNHSHESIDGSTNDPAIENLLLKYQTFVFFMNCFQTDNSKNDSNRQRKRSILPPY